MKEQTTAEDAETVQVFDVDGVPHKISKQELISKAGVQLPSLEEIGGFVAYDTNGQALGLMSKEQVAQVVGGLIPVATENNKGLAIPGSFIKLKKNIQSPFTIQVNGFVIIRNLSDTSIYTLYFASGNQLVKLSETGGIALKLSLQNGNLTITPNTSPDAWHDIIYCKF